jgi:hypothetical protein
LQESGIEKRELKCVAKFARKASAIENSSPATMESCLARSVIDTLAPSMYPGVAMRARPPSAPGAGDRSSVPEDLAIIFEDHPSTEYDGHFIYKQIPPPTPKG